MPTEHEPKAARMQTVYYRDREGSEPVRDYLAALPPAVREEVVATVRLLNRLDPQDPPLPFPFSSQVEGPLRELRVDGGVSRSAPLLQFQADLLGVPVVRPPSVETTALGAASLAGLAVGFWNDREDLVRSRSDDTLFKPSRQHEEMVRLREGWNRALERAKGWERPI